MNDEPPWMNECRELARTVRAHCLRMTHHGRSGHVGSMLPLLLPGQRWRLQCRG